MAETNKGQTNWEEAIDKGASLNRWDAELLGPAMENYRDYLCADDQRQFIKDLPSLFTNGKRLSDYRADVNKQTEEDAGQAVLFDQTQFYKEVEAAMIEKQTTARSPGFLKKFINWLFRKRLPKEVRKLGDDKKLEGTLQAIYEHYDKIDEINADIFYMKNNLSALEGNLVENVGTPLEEKIRMTINKQQTIIREAMTERAQVMKEKTNPKEILSAELMKAVRSALKKESKIINEKFGNEIARLFRERQVLINQTTMIGNESPESITKKLDLQSKIEQTDIKLDEIKKDLIKYKSKQPIFLFERLVGVQSIPMVYRFGQASTLQFDYKEEEKLQKQSNT